MRILYLGDLHGNFGLIHQYVDMYDIKDAYIIQVGDFGVGFNSVEKEKRMLEMYHKKLVDRNVIIYAIRGNHDLKSHFDKDPFGFTNIKLIPDYEVLDIEGNKILCIGGAVSVDRVYRYTKAQRNGNFTINGNESWWPDEPFVFNFDKLKDLKNINIVVTHTCPDYCHPDNNMGLGPFVNNIIKDTGDEALRVDLMVERKAVTDAFNIIKMNNNITLACYGHFHRSYTQNMFGTKHVLLGVGELHEERDDVFNSIK